MGWKSIPTLGMITCGLINILPAILLARGSLLVSTTQGFKTTIATITPYVVSGLVFDIIGGMIPVKGFRWKCFAFWAAFFPASRAGIDVLTCLLNYSTLEEMYAYMLFTYPSALAVFGYYLPMALFGLGYGFVFSKIYILVYVYVMKRTGGKGGGSE